MATLTLLGTGGVVAPAGRTTTMLALQSGSSILLADCGGDVVQRVLEAGLDVSLIDALFISHEHPDHVAGFPLLVEKLWIHGRKRPIPVIGIRQAIEQAQRCWAAFRTDGWDVPELDWRVIELQENFMAFENESWQVTASPGDHSVPVSGFRFEDRRAGGVVAYSADTAPCTSITELSRRSDILVHEANGAGPGHSTMQQAAQVAHRAQAHRLLLVHLSQAGRPSDLVEAQSAFAATELGIELGQYTF